MNWIGTPEFQMGGNTDLDNSQETLTPSDLLSATKSNIDNLVTTEHTSGITSPVDNVSLADDNQSSIEVLDEDSIIANFSCDVATSTHEKIAGLQIYDGLSNSAGLLFKYNRPEDVTYHMGTVSFPIDIIFINAENKIKKIYKDIKPGTLGTFSCAGVKNVLEICGGLSDRLGINVGNRIKVTDRKSSEIYGLNELNKYSKGLINKNIIIKYSSILETKISNWKTFPILNINTQLIKQASKKTLLSDLIQKFSKSPKNISAFDIDTFIKDSNINIFKTSSFTDDNDVPFIDINNNVVSIKENIYKKCTLSTYDKDFNILSSHKSLINFMNDEDSENVLEKIYKLSNKNKIVLLSRHDINLLKKVINSKLTLKFGSTVPFEIIKLNNDDDILNISTILKNKYSNMIIEVFSDETLFKNAGSPVPDEIKNKARKVLKLLLAAQDLIDNSADNLTNNLTEYKNIQDKADLIRDSKGQYFQSVKNNKNIIRDYLVHIRDAIKILNDIKDISTTLEIIDGLTMTAKEASDQAEEVFDLIEQLSSPEFIMLLTEATETYIRTIDDLNLTIKRALDYINKDVLGLVILSD